MKKYGPEKEEKAKIESFTTTQAKKQTKNPKIVHNYSKK